MMSAEPKRCKLVVNNKMIEQQVMKVDYLGIKLSNYREVEDEVRQQVNT